jgi:phage shock protein A
MSKVSKRDEFLDQMEAQLNVWRAQISQFDAKAEKETEERKEEMKKKIGNLQNQINEFEDRMEAIRQTNKEAWEDLKEGAEKAWSKLSKSFSSLVSTLY